MKIFFLIISLLVACASKKGSFSKKYIIMNSLWEKNSTKDEVVKSLGSEFKETPESIIYLLINTKSIESGHFFDKSQKMIEQFIILDEKSLEDLKTLIPCSWNESQKMESVGHTAYLVRRGKCLERNISYEFKPGSNNYEARWQK